MITTKIVFPALLKGFEFTTQTVSVGGIFPIVEIESVDEATGLHHFKITKSLPNYGEAMLASAIAESELQFEQFINILAYLLNVPIRFTGQVFYENHGRLMEFDPKPPKSIGVGVSVVSGPWSQEMTSMFHKKYDYDLLKRFTFAKAIEEPIGRFISLYSLLSSLCSDKQDEIDKMIEGVEPNVAKSHSPKTEKTEKNETIFTRLRNELAHHRVGVSVIETHRSISLHLVRFEWIVKTIVDERIHR